MKAYLKVDKRAAERWHTTKRIEAFTKARDGEIILRNLGDGYYSSGFVIKSWEQYNYDLVGYEIRTSVYVGNHNRGTTLTSGPALLVHVEPASEFPSEHLKTKLLLLVG